MDYRTASRAEIDAVSGNLIGRSLADVASRPAARIISSSGTKGGIGAIYESYFGIPPNSRQEADFPGAGIELKSVPVVRRAGDWHVKERTVISMIQYDGLAREEWSSATVRKKIAEVLFIFYGWLPDTDLYDFVTERVVLWKPGDDLLPFLAGDWEAVRRKVLAGQAHEISESDGRILGAATKGVNSLARVSQPFSDIRAKPRAWAFKPSLTESIFREAAPSEAIQSLIALLAKDKPLSYEERVVARLNNFVGLPLGDIADALGMPIGAGKATGARIVRRALGLRPTGPIREFERFGVEVKTTPISPSGKPWESMSFPAFRYRELADEDWEDSDLLSRLNRLFIIPLVRDEEDTPFAEHRLGRPFFWSPTADELEEIEREWTLFRDEIRIGHADDLPKPKTTKYIHVRTKGRNSLDKDDAPVVGLVPKKAFWLNASYVSLIVTQSSTDWRGKRP